MNFLIIFESNEYWTCRALLSCETKQRICNSDGLCFTIFLEEIYGIYKKRSPVLVLALKRSNIRSNVYLTKDYMLYTYNTNEGKDKGKSIGIALALSSIWPLFLFHPVTTYFTYLKSYKTLLRLFLRYPCQNKRKKPWKLSFLSHIRIWLRIPNNQVVSINETSQL